MVHLIDKDALVAEIESLLDKGRYHEEYDCAYRDGNNSALYALKGKINTLEVNMPDWNEGDDSAYVRIADAVEQEYTESESEELINWLKSKTKL